MSNDNNKAPFNWNTLTDKAIWALLASMAFWVWHTHNRVAKIEDYDRRFEEIDRVESMHWQIHSQQRNAFNDLVDTINDRRDEGEDKIPRFRWDIDSDTD